MPSVGLAVHRQNAAISVVFGVLGPAVANSIRLAQTPTTHFSGFKALNSESNSKTPLLGLTVMVTRPAPQAHSLASLLRHHGADAIIEPVIEILPPLDWGDLDSAIQKTAEGRVSTLVFVSVNGVHGFFERFAQLSQAENMGGPPKLANMRVLAIGNATSEALAERDIVAQTVPGKSDSNSVADFLISTPIGGETLIVRADRGSDVLPKRLSASEIDFQQVVAYRSVDRKTVPDSSKQALRAGKIDWVTVTSSAIARSLVLLFGTALNQTKLVSISPTTSAALRNLGYPPAAEASEYHMQGIVDAIIASKKAT